MVNNHAKWVSAFALTTLLTACGGGDSSPAPPSPPVGPSTLKLEVFTGKVSVDFDHCESSNGTATAAQYSHLLRASVYQKAVYLAETGENCKNLTYSAPGFIPENLRPAIRKVSAGAVETAVRLNDYFAVGMSHPIMVRYPGGVHIRDGETFVLAYAAASSDRGFTLDVAEVARYTRDGGWDYFVPGLFQFTGKSASYNDLIAGRPGKPPALVDGQEHEAGFVAPHDFEDAAGLFYLIDQGQIRTIDADNKVATLNLSTLGITGSVKALDTDLAGHVHVLAQKQGPSYTWHRLADGSKVDFRVRDFVQTETLTVETFTVVGNDLLLAVRDAQPGSLSRLYRVSDSGVVTELTGSSAPTASQDLLDNPSKYLLPSVQHLEYGVDGHLYIVLPQGVLRARDFK